MAIGGNKESDGATGEVVYDTVADVESSGAEESVGGCHATDEMKAAAAKAGKSEILER